LRSYFESDLPKANPLIRPIKSPFGDETVYAVPPLKPDVTVVHAQRADADGNTQVWGLLGCQKEAAFAAERLIVVVEEPVDETIIRADPTRTIIPGLDKIDFRTSPGNLGGAEAAAKIRREEGWLGSGPTVVVTDLGIYHFNDDGEMRLDSIHPGATLDQIRDTIGWESRLAEPLAVTPAPTAEELRLIREEMDPEGAYTK
jgi:hypothetical protein